MKKEEFFIKLAEALETDVKLDEKIILKDLPEYSSLTSLAIIVLIDECFGKRISAKELNSLSTVGNLIQFIGEEHFSS